MANVETPPLLVRWFGARGAVITAYAIGALFVGLFVLMSYVDADSGGDWGIVAVGATVGAAVATALARRGKLFKPAAKTDFRSGVSAVVLGAAAAAVATALGLSDRVWLAVYGLGIAVMIVGVRTAWPWTTTIAKWSTWPG